jgi:tetratricopeptide (TPR) repeat protein
MMSRDARAQFHYRVANLFLRLHRDEAAANAYARVLRIRPNDAQAQFQRAWCLLHVPRRRNEGITAFQSLLRVSPSAAGFFLMGCGLQQESRHEEAVQAFREAARLESPGAADLHYNYAMSLTALRRLEDAADAYGNATHLNPSDGEAWGNLGAAFAELGRWKDAAPCQERAMRLAPSLTHGLNLGSTLYELNRLEEAERVLRDVLVLDPRSVDAKEWLATVLTAQDRYDEAIKIARETCESNSDAVSSRVVLAGALSEAGCLDEALRIATAAAEAAPEDARVHGALGTVYVKMKDGAAALAAFERMAECLIPDADRLPSSPWVSYLTGRGVAFSLLGRHDDAMAAFSDVLSIDREYFERWPEVAPYYQLSSREAGRRTPPRLG